MEGRIKARLAQIPSKNFPWDSVLSGSSETTIKKGIILKRPVSAREKGVLFISFENQWMRLLRHGNVEAIARDFHLVLAPSWSPPHDMAFLLADKFWPGPFFHLLSNYADPPIFARLSSKAVAVPLLASNWVHPHIFGDAGSNDKPFDIVVLANFSPYKRHFALFKLLRQMRTNAKVLLLGTPWAGRTEQNLRDEAALYGVQDNITIRARLPDQELVPAMRSAKTGLIPSLNEGSCVAVVELMFVNVPVAMFDDAVIGSKAFINPRTGCLLHGQNPAAQMADFIARYRDYTPRQWAIDNAISCFGSTAILNSCLRRFSLDRGDSWTEDIVAHHWRPNPAYVYHEDLAPMRKLYSTFEHLYGLSLQSPAGENAPVGLQSSATT